MSKRPARKPKPPVLSASEEQLKSWEDQLRVVGAALQDFEHLLRKPKRLSLQVQRVVQEMFGGSSSEKK